MDTLIAVYILLAISHQDLVRSLKTRLAGLGTKRSTRLEVATLYSRYFDRGIYSDAETFSNGFDAQAMELLFVFFLLLSYISEFALHMRPDNRQDNRAATERRH